MKKFVVIFTLIFVLFFNQNAFSQNLERSKFGIGLNMGFPHLIGLEINFDINDPFSIRAIGSYFGEDLMIFRGDFIYRPYVKKYSDFYFYGGYSYINVLDSEGGVGNIGIGYEVNWQKAWPGLIPIFWGGEVGYLIGMDGTASPILAGASIRFHF